MIRQGVGSLVAWGSGLVFSERQQARFHMGCAQSLARFYPRLAAWHWARVLELASET